MYSTSLRAVPGRYHILYPYVLSSRVKLALNNL